MPDRITLRTDVMRVVKLEEVEGGVLITIRGNHGVLTFPDVGGQLKIGLGDKFEGNFTPIDIAPAMH